MLHAATSVGKYILDITDKCDILAWSATRCAPISNFNVSVIVIFEPDRLEQTTLTLVVFGIDNSPAKWILSMMVRSVNVANVADVLDALVFTNSTSFVNVVLFTTLKLEVVIDSALTFGMTASLDNDNRFAFTITLF
jgi:hypothetical protein